MAFTCASLICGSHRLLRICLAPLCRQVLVHRQQLCLVNCRGCLWLSTVIMGAVSPVPIVMYILLFLWLIVPLPAAPESLPLRQVGWNWRGDRSHWSFQMAKLALGFCLIADGQTETKWKAFCFVFVFSSDEPAGSIFINTCHFYSFLSETATFPSPSTQYHPQVTCCTAPYRITWLTQCKVSTRHFQSHYCHNKNGSQGYSVLFIQSLSNYQLGIMHVPDLLLNLGLCP